MACQLSIDCAIQSPVLPICSDPSGNRAPQLVDTPPEVTVFSGQSFRLNLVGADPDGTQSFFRLAMATANVSLSHDGQLSGQLYTSRNSSRQFDVVLFDECDRETNVRIEVGAKAAAARIVRQNTAIHVT